MAKAPPSAKDARWCPLIGRGCIEQACMFWIGIWGKASPDAEPELDWECSINWSVLLQKETLVETARVTAGHDKVANQGATLNHLIAVGLQRKALEDQHGPVVVE